MLTRCLSRGAACAWPRGAHGCCVGAVAPVQREVIDSAELQTRHDVRIADEGIDIQTILVSALAQEASRATSPEDRDRHLQAALAELWKLRDFSGYDPMPFLDTASNLYDVLASFDAEDGLSQYALQVWRQIGSEIAKYLDLVGRREEDNYIEAVLTCLQQWRERGEKTFAQDRMEEIEGQLAHANQQMSSFLVYYDTAECGVDELRIEGDDEIIDFTEYDDGMIAPILSIYQSAHIALLLHLADIRTRMGVAFSREAFDAIRSMVELHLKYFPGERWIESRQRIYEHAIALYDQCGFYAEADACREELQKLSSGGGEQESHPLE